MSVEHVLKVTHLFYNKIKAECVFWLICILVAANVVRSAVLLQFALNKTISFYFQRFSVQWVWLFFTQKLWTTSDGLKTTRNKTRAGPSSSWFPPSCVSSFPVWQLSWPPGGSGETTVTDQWRSPTVREQTDNMVLCHFTVTDWWDHDIHSTTAPPSAQSSSRSSYSCRIPVFIFACWLESPGYVWVFKGSANTN